MKETKEVETIETEGYTFEHNNKKIDVEFELVIGQREALIELINFVDNEEDKFITLQGPAGTGKTAVIGYVQKYFKKSHTFVYMAPTHAATAELAFATVKTGNKSLPMTVTSGFYEAVNRKTRLKEAAMTKKLIDKLGFSNNIIVIDEVSMLNSLSHELITQVISNYNAKVIFMGDILQIPEVDSNNPLRKQVSSAFTQHKQLYLTEVKRTDSDSILKVLTNIRANKNGQIPLISNTDELKYLKQSEFETSIVETFKTEPEESVLIAYTNHSVQSSNKKIRQSLGRVGDLQKDDIVVGYAGYNSKQIENGDVANSVRYTVTLVEKKKSQIHIHTESKKLSILETLKVKGVTKHGFAVYLQLSENDAFVFEDLKQNDLDSNNRTLAIMFGTLSRKKQDALKNPAKWTRYYDYLASISKFFQTNNLGGNYIYNPTTDKMEEYDSLEHSKLKKTNPEFYVEKGIDFGHAITIHKSQGSTVKNVFFDATTLPKGGTPDLYQGTKLIGSEKHSLLYVGVSRASKKLIINSSNPDNFYEL